MFLFPNRMAFWQWFIFYACLLPWQFPLIGPLFIVLITRKAWVLFRNSWTFNIICWGVWYIWHYASNTVYMSHSRPQEQGGGWWLYTTMFGTFLHCWTPWRAGGQSWKVMNPTCAAKWCAWRYNCENLWVDVVAKLSMPVIGIVYLLGMYRGASWIALYLWSNRLSALARACRPLINILHSCLAFASCSFLTSWSLNWVLRCHCAKISRCLLSSKNLFISLSSSVCIFAVNSPFQSVFSPLLCYFRIL